MKLQKTKFFNIIYVILSIIFITTIGFTWDIKFPGDTVLEEELSYGAFHFLFNTFFILGWIVLFIVTIRSHVGDGSLYKGFYTEDKNDKSEALNINFKSTFKKIFLWSMGLILALFVYNESKQLKLIYNSSIQYKNAYDQKVMEKIGFYDKLWKTFLGKEKITNINKDVFILVTKTIMENRKDGQNITWKWIQENQQIDYSEFTKFYADLSNFIESQREGYFNIEKECQSIAYSNNTLLDTFPNNFYNKLLGCDHINFEYGMLSDSTINVFNSKKENIK